MFEEMRLFGTTVKRIVLQTRTGNDIKNEIGLEPEARHFAKFSKIVHDHFGWRVRKHPCGGYNCFGHVWASRRTAVYDDFDAQAQKVLADDGYRKLAEFEPPMTGDLVLYWSESPRQLHHIGAVAEMRDGPATSSPTIPWVLSKIDDSLGEVLHHHADPAVSVPVTAEFWTDRR
jgi:hypothetical protein